MRGWGGRGFQRWLSGQDPLANTSLCGAESCLLCSAQRSRPSEATCVSARTAHADPVSGGWPLHLPSPLSCPACPGPLQALQCEAPPRLPPPSPMTLIFFQQALSLLTTLRKPSPYSGTTDLCSAPFGSPGLRAWFGDRWEIRAIYPQNLNPPSLSPL